MSVRYKFRNDLDFAAIPCDGFSISVRELKLAIVRMKRLGRATNFDLEIVNQQNNKVFVNENDLIPKNSTLIAIRKPLPQGHQKIWEADELPVAGAATPNGSGISFTAGYNEGSEEDRISRMVRNSGDMYDQKNWLKFRGRTSGGRPHPYYRCNKCNTPGHWVTDCKLSSKPSNHHMDMRKPTTGIPRSFLKPATKDTPGAKLSPQGLYMVVEMEKQAYEKKKIEKPYWSDDENTSG